MELTREIVETAIQEAIESFSKVENINFSSSSLSLSDDLGLDSLNRVEIMIRIEQSLEIGEINLPNNFDMITTVKDFKDFVFKSLKV